MQQRRRVRIKRRGGDVSELAGGTRPNGMGEKGAATEVTRVDYDRGFNRGGNPTESIIVPEPVKAPISADYCCVCEGNQLGAAGSGRRRIWF